MSVMPHVGTIPLNTRRIILIMLLAQLATGRTSAQMFSQKRIKAEYTLLIASYVSWEEEEQVDHFRIGVLNDPQVFNEFSFKSEMNELKGKPFEVRSLRRLKDISDVHILYVGRSRNSELRRITSRIKGQPVLMVTDSAQDYDHVMVNLLAMNQRGKPFELNKSNIEAAGMGISNKVLLLGGSEEDLRDIYRAAEKELGAVRKELEQLNKDMQEQMNLLEARKEEIDRLTLEIGSQKEELELLSRDITRQQAALQEKTRVLAEREAELREKETEIEEKNTRLARLLADIEASSDILQQQRMDIQQQAKQIDDQTAVLDKQKLTIERQKHILYFFIVVIALAGGLVFIMIWAYRVKKHANRVLEMKNESIRKQKEEIQVQREQLQLVNEQIERQNENIKASIYYALTIQQAILPLRDEIDRYFDNFIIYNPKDIVSGDFYWISQYRHEPGDRESIFLAVADCTGHGVPGGFLSMVGTRLLNAIVNEQQIHEPKTILEEMDQRLRIALKQDRTDNDDGMDVCLCRVDRSSGNEEKWVTVVFAGAKRPLFHTRSKKIIERLPGSRRSLGGRYQKDTLFAQYSLDLERGERLYLTTDGLPDQHSPSREKFGYRRMVEILSETVQLSMGQQKNKLDEALIGFQKLEKQRDDITVLGIEL